MDMDGNSKTIVLETRGKNEDVDSVKIHLFEYASYANEYCEKLNNACGDRKYWRHAEIVNKNTLYELGHAKLYPCSYD